MKGNLVKAKTKAPKREMRGEAKTKPAATAASADLAKAAAAPAGGSPRARSARGAKAAAAVKPPRMWAVWDKMRQEGKLSVLPPKTGRLRDIVGILAKPGEHWISDKELERFWKGER